MDIIGGSFVSARSSVCGSSLLLSRARFDTGLEGLSFHRPADAPPVWPAILTSWLHNVSMGAAMMLWIDVCQEVVAGTRPDAPRSAAQQFYGRLLAVNALCELISSQFVGVASDAYGRRVMQLSAQLGQLIDYTAAALCLPSLGMIGVLPASTGSRLLYFSRGVAGLLGNYKVSLQSYTTDISSAEECPGRLAYVGAALVVGMCCGSLTVAISEQMELSYRANYFFSTALNMIIMGLVQFLWRDVAPKKDFKCAEAYPTAGMQVFASSRAMLTYASLTFLACFALNMFTSTLAFYCEANLGMDKSLVITLGGLWALESAFCLSVVQPFLVRNLGEIMTLKLSFAAMAVFYALFSFLTEHTYWISFVIMILFSLGSVCYPLAVGLATREVSPDEQGSLQGALSILETIGKIVAPLLASDILIPMFEGEGKFHGMVYFVAGGTVLPGIYLAHSLHSLTSRVAIPEQPVAVELHEAVRTAK